MVSIEFYLFSMFFLAMFSGLLIGWIGRLRYRAALKHFKNEIKAHLCTDPDLIRAKLHNDC